MWCISVYCPSGFEVSGAMGCQGCDVGFYKDNSEDVFGSCQACPSDFITPAENSTSVADCTVGESTSSCMSEALVTMGLAIYFNALMMKL